MYCSVKVAIVSSVAIASFISTSRFVNVDAGIFKIVN